MATGGFLLNDDAVAAAQTQFDAWVKEQEDRARRARETVQGAVTQIGQGVSGVSGQDLTSGPAQAMQRFDAWVAEQTAKLQPAAQPGAAASIPQALPAVQPQGAAAPVPSPEQSPQERFDQWVAQQQAPQPQAVQAQPAQPASLPHTEEPATVTDQVPAGPDLGGRWKTSFDFGSTYTGNYRTGTPHRGIDLVPLGGGGIGAEVSAFHPGRVTNISRDSGAGGLMVYIQDDQGLTHAYMHLANTVPGLKVGDQVQRGQPIAQMGESGTEGSPHLHYEVRKNAATGDPLNQLIDPRPYMAGALGSTRAADTSRGVPGAPATQTTAGLSGGGQLAGQVGERGQQILQGAADIAGWLGSEGQKVLQSVLVTEGGLSGARGDQGASAGPLQFFGEEGGRSGQLNAFARALGMTLEQARQYATEHPLEAIAWAIGTATNPGYLGLAIMDGITRNLTGADLATHVQRIGQVSVSPERAGEVYKRLFGQGEEPIAAATTAARAATQGALQGAVEGTAAARARAEELARTSGTQLEQLQAQTGQLQTEFQRANEAARQQSEQFRTGVEQQIAQTQAGLRQAREFPGIQQAQAMSQAILEPEPVQRGLAAAAAAPLPPLGGQSLDQMARNIGEIPQNLGHLGQAITGAGTEAERQLAEPPLTTMAARVGANLVGRELAPEIEQAITAATPPMVRAITLDPGGVVSSFLKTGDIVPASQTVDLPLLGPTPVADLIGLAANIITPMGAEGRFAQTATQRALQRAASELRYTTRAQQGFANLGERILETPGEAFRPRWAQALGSRTGEARDAARLAMSGAGRWARASVQDIMNDLAQGPVGNFVRDEAGELNLGALEEIATRVKQQMIRVYSGGIGDFERADLARADPEALAGPAFYTTEDPRIAGGRVAEAQQGWAARFGNADIGFEYGPIKATQREAAQWLKQSQDELLARYTGLTRRELPKALIVPRSRPALVEAEGYAQARASAADLPTTETFESWDRNIARYQQRIADIEARLGAGESPTAPESPTGITFPLGTGLQKAREDLARMVAERERGLAQPSGMNVRPLDVPADLKLFDFDEGMSHQELYDLADQAAAQGMRQTEQTLIDQALTSMRNYPVPGQTVYDALQRQAGLSKAQINQFLERAGYEGITHMGGAIRPMFDEFGQQIEHRVRALFQSGLDRSRTLAGRQAAVAPEAALGGAAGATTDEDLSPQERLYRGLGGAFVAATLRGKNPAVAAFEAQALRRGATAQMIRDAVQSARAAAGKVSKFSGPIADAANAAHKTAPAPEQVQAARQMLREFGDKAALLRAAPPSAQNDSGMARLHNFLLELARQGESQRFWYSNASQAIMDAAGQDRDKAEKLAQLFAIYSPGNTVSANTQMALAAWHQFLEGIPIEVGKGQLDKKASDLLYRGIPWEGRKTNNFYRNLMKHIDNDVWQAMGREDGQTGTTVDIWMMRALQYLQDAPSMGAKGQYEFAQRAIERVAKEMGWQPDEAQAAIWSAYKAATEGGTLGEAGYHYGTGLAERAGRVGGLGPTPGIQGDLQRVFGLFGQEGAPSLPAEKASRTLYDAEGNAIRNAKGEPISVPIPEARGMVSRAAKQTIDAYAAARAWIEQLPEISWARVFPEAKPTLRDANALVAEVGRPLDEAEITQLRQRLGPDVSVTQTEQGAWIVNHAGSHIRTPGAEAAGQWQGASNRDFHKAADAALRELSSVQEASTYPLRADTSTLRNDWSANPNGEGYADVINRSARAQAFWDVADPLAARVREAGGRLGAALTSAQPGVVEQLRAGAAAGPAPTIPGRVPGAADIAELARPRLAETGLAQAARETLQPTDAEVIARASPQALENARRLAGLTQDAPTEADVANILRASELGQGAAGGVSARLGAQAGQITPRFAAELGTTAAGGIAGYATAPEGATQEERLKRAAAGALGAGALAVGGPRLAQMSPATRAQVQDVATWLRAQTPSQTTARAVGQAAGPQTGGERAVEWISSNLLSGPGLVWNSLTQAMHLGWQPLVRATSGHPIEALRGLQAMVAAAPEALQRAGAVWTQGPYAGVMGQQARPLAKTSLGLKANLSFDALLRSLNENMGGMLEAQRLIREAGATTPQAAQSVIAQNATRIAEAAAKEGHTSALTQGTARSPWLRDLTAAKMDLLRSPNVLKQAAGVMMHVAMPFARVPEEALYQAFRNAPVLGQVWDAFRIVKPAAGDTRAEAAAKTALNAAMMATVIGAAINGQIRGPEDPEHPDQVNLPGLGWMPLSALGTVGGRMSIAAAVIESLQKVDTEPNQTGLDRIGRAVNSIGKLAEREYPLADQVRLLSRIGQGDITGAATGFGSDVLAGATPLVGTLGMAENITDPLARQAATTGWRGVYEPNLARIPGTAQTLPSQVNMLTGEPAQRPSSGPGAALRIQNVGKIQSPLAQEIARLEKLGYKISEPKEAPKTINVRGSTVKLTEAEQRNLATQRGQLIQRQLGEYINSPYWNRLTDTQKARMIERILNRVESRIARTGQRVIPTTDIAGRAAAARRETGRLVALGAT